MSYKSEAKYRTKGFRIITTGHPARVCNNMTVKRDFNNTVRQIGVRILREKKRKKRGMKNKGMTEGVK